MTKVTIPVLPSALHSLLTGDDYPVGMKCVIEVDVPEGHSVHSVGVPHGDLVLGRIGVYTPSPPKVHHRILLQKTHRVPVMPNDYGKACEFSDKVTFGDGTVSGDLVGIAGVNAPCRFMHEDGETYAFARIKN